MFQVRSRRSGKVRTVYAVGPFGKFLLHRDGKWAWENSRYYEPLEEVKHG